ncbi:uncharacterized protein HKW66_Vig0149460 [Vigna angularis]|uniref:Uncharacterized protein n=1 Tax=Phaseolus angularis TaxID=3914 RepID=A0A8T0JXF0_PHAAN|nr:uncharacterized protein HKW66_Vig0149460 [Vigna angularis]
MVDFMQRSMEMIKAEQATKGYNSCSSNSFNNHASSPQDFGGATINNGQYAGNRNRFKHSEHYDEQKNIVVAGKMLFLLVVVKARWSSEKVEE